MSAARLLRIVGDSSTNPLSQLHPAHVRSALRRRVFALGLRSLRPGSYPALVHLGSDHGGWTVPADLIDDDWTCWCVGAGADISFELELLKRFGPRVRSFDPFDVFRDQAIAVVGDDPRFSFHVVAVAPDNGPLRMWGRQDSEHGSLSAVNLYDAASVFEKRGATLDSLRVLLGDRRVDLLKLDIEGLEYDLLQKADLRRLGVRVLCVELHDNANAQRARHLVSHLAERGYELIHRAGVADMTFLYGGEPRVPEACSEPSEVM